MRAPWDEAKALHTDSIGRTRKLIGKFRTIPELMPTGMAAESKSAVLTIAEAPCRNEIGPTATCLTALRTSNDSHLPEVTHFKCNITVPSETVGAATPVLLAFLAIQSRATRMLSSVPALSS